MARKRKTEGQESEYDVLVGFVHEFTFVSPDDLERLSGHPVEGRVYRILKDPYGWRIHIGRDNNKENLDGLFLGDEGVYELSTGLLKSEQRRYSYTIEIVTPSNYLTLPIMEEDRSKVMKWLDTENNDLWEGLRKEESGEQPVIRTGTDLLRLLLNQNNTNGQGKKEDVKAVITPPSASLAERERALEATLTLMTHFQNKPVEELVALYDAMFNRILKNITR